MPGSFAEKLAFLSKFLSISRARMAAELGVDKSVVGRWLSGFATPSPHNLSLLTQWLSEQIPGFTALDWDKDLNGLAARCGVQPSPPVVSPVSGLATALPLLFLDEILTTTQRRGGAYEGFFRSTRPYTTRPGKFLHDQCLVRRHANGLLRLLMCTGGVTVDGWVLPLQDKLFAIGAECTSGALVFCILHGVNSKDAEILDGVTLSPIMDAGRTLAATPVVFERIGDLTDDAAADEARLRALGSGDPMAPEGTVPKALREHLVREIGDAALAAGGDWVLRSPLTRALSRGFLER
jgi:transcriptional regulator with XRE-family HTH domain